MANNRSTKATTARKLASELGISVATVSRALNSHPDVSPETRSRVVQMADNLGYMPRVGRRRTNVIGLVYPTDPVRADYGNFESAMLAGILDGVNEQRYDVTIINVQRDKDPADSYSQFFRAKGVGGVIVRRIHPSSRMAEEIADEGFPYIYTDSHEDSKRAVEHLIHLGHRRIALGVHNVIDSDHRDRRNGYVKALEEAGIELDPALLIQSPASMAGGASSIDRLLSLPNPPTAIYFTDPQTTVGAMHRCLVRGISVPRDLSIVGFDDGDARAQTFPRYTAVCQDARQMGLEASRWLTRVLAAGGEIPSYREHRYTTWSVSESTGMPPARTAKSGTE